MKGTANKGHSLTRVTTCKECPFHGILFVTLDAAIWVTTVLPRRSRLPAPTPSHLQRDPDALPSKTAVPLTVSLSLTLLLQNDTNENTRQIGRR
jgi:hypothetical protein